MLGYLMLQPGHGECAMSICSLHVFIQGILCMFHIGTFQVTFASRESSPFIERFYDENVTL